MRSFFATSPIGIFLTLLVGGCASSGDPSLPPGSPETEALVDFCERRAGRQSYGLYVQDQKIGWLTAEFRRGEYENRGAAILEATGQIRFPAPEGAVNVGLQLKRVYGLIGVGPLLLAEDVTTSDESPSRVRAVREDDHLIVDFALEGLERRVRTEPTRETLRKQLEFEAWLQAERRPGDEIIQYSIDLDSVGEAIESEVIDPDEEETHTFAGVRDGHWGGVPVTISVVRSRSATLSTTTEFLPNGQEVRFHLGPFEARLEEEAVAKNLDLQVADMLSRIAVATDLGDPVEVSRLVVKLRGLGEFDIPESASQRVQKRQEGGVVLEIVQGRTSAPTGLREDEHGRYTAATLRIQSDDERIRSLAREVAGDESEPRAAAQLLQAWVFVNLEGSYTRNAETAVRVLENRAGDCTEHALLFVALARALGIPAREVGGLVYVKEDEPGFSWHAWAEIHDGTRWISVDPAFDEVDVDATHIVLSSDSQAMSWLALLGRLKIEVLEFERREPGSK